MSEISAISPAKAIRVVRPIGNAGSENDARRDTPFAARQAYAKSGPRTERATHQGDYAPFVTQTFANDNATASASQGAIAYLVTRYRMTDLPIGFLIAKSA
jgi:hypothetical protein